MKILVLNPNTSEAVPAADTFDFDAEGPPNPRSHWAISTALGLTP